MSNQREWNQQLALQMGLNLCLVWPAYILATTDEMMTGQKVGLELLLGGVFGAITASQLTSRFDDLRHAMCLSTFMMVPECIFWIQGWTRQAVLGFVARFLSGWGMALLLVLVFTFVHRQLANDNNRGYQFGSLLTYFVLMELLTYCIGQKTSKSNGCKLFFTILLAISGLLWLWLEEFKSLGSQEIKGLSSQFSRLQGLLPLVMFMTCYKFAGNLQGYYIEQDLQNNILVAVTVFSATAFFAFAFDSDNQGRCFRNLGIASCFALAFMFLAYYQLQSEISRYFNYYVCHFVYAGSWGYMVVFLSSITQKNNGTNAFSVLLTFTFLCLIIVSLVLFYSENMFLVLHVLSTAGVLAQVNQPDLLPKGGKGYQNLEQEND